MVKAHDQQREISPSFSVVPPARKASQLNCIETHREGQEEVNGMSGTKGEVLVLSDASRLVLTKTEVLANRALAVDVVTP